MAWMAPMREVSLATKGPTMVNQPWLKSPHHTYCSRSGIDSKLSGSEAKRLADDAMMSWRFGTAGDRTANMFTIGRTC